MSEECPRVGNSPGQSFLRADSFPPGYTLFSVGGMAQDKEWSKHFWGKTHSLQVTLCLVSEEWPRVGNGPGSEIKNNPSSLVEKNGEDSPLLIFYIEGGHSFRPHRCEWNIGPDDYFWYSILRADILSDLTDVSERLAQMIQFYHNLVSMQMKTTVVADTLSDLTDVSERLAQMIQFLS